MTSSQARIDANRRNAQKSTGPRTPEGKARSRTNAIQHGLCASEALPEDADLITNRSGEYFRALLPQNAYQAWMCNEAALLSLRIDRCERMERRVRDKVSLRAGLTWDDDRKSEAEVLARSLASQPSETVDALRRTPHGCDWLMGRWSLLANAALTSDTKGWTEEQVKLAFDLSGTPAIFRAGKRPGFLIDLDGGFLDDGSDPVGVARRMVAELKERRDEVAGLDEVERVLVEVDLDHDSDPELRRIRRYETTLHNRHRWAINQVKEDPSKRRQYEELCPKWLSRPAPERKPEPKSSDEILAANHPSDSFSPPFDLTPDEFPPLGQKADIPQILKSRRTKKIRKEEARREARRRKVEVLRN